MSDVKQVATIVLSGVGLLQTAYIFYKNRKDKAVADSRQVCDRRIATVEADLAAHIKEDREMHERLRGVETKLDGTQQQMAEMRDRHRELVSRIDLIRSDMMTKEDFKNLLEVIKSMGK